MYPILKHIFFFIGLSWIVVLSAQEQQYFRDGYTGEKDHYTKFDLFSSGDGLVSDDVKLVLQDQYGYMWFGTSNGLSKYNGYEFTNYQNFENDSTSISNSFITAIEEDIYGDLWIGTRNGLNKLNRDQGTFQRFYAKKGSVNQLQDNYIKDLLADSSGILWIDTYEGYLHKYRITESSFVSYKHPPSENDIYFIHRLFKDGNKIWIFYRNRTCIFNMDNEDFELFEDRDIKASKVKNQTWFAHYSAAIKDERGNYYFGNMHSRGIVYHPTKQELTDFPFGSVYDILKTKSGQIYMSGYSLGLLQYDSKSNHFKHYTKSDDNPYSIPSMQIWDVLEDEIGNIWLATPSGIGKLSPEKQKFQHVRHISNIKESIISNDVQDIIQTKDSNIWVATFEGINVLNRKKKSIETYQHDSKIKGSILSNKVKCLYQDSEETIWVGGWSGLGLDFKRKNSVNFDHYSISSDFNGYDWYIGFAEGNKDLYIGLWGSVALAKFNRNKLEMYNSFKRIGVLFKSDILKLKSYKDHLFFNYFYYHSYLEDRDLFFGSKDMPKNMIKIHSDFIKVIDRSSYEYPNGYEVVNDVLYTYTNYNLWIFDTIIKTMAKQFSENLEINCIEGAQENFCLWIGNEDKLKKIRLKPHVNELIEINMAEEITDIYSKGDIIYVGTLNGLFYAKESTLRSFDQLIEFKELKDKKVNKILLDRMGYLCVSTNEGLYYFDDTKSLVMHYTSENSNLSNSIIHDIYIDRQGNLWLGTQEGLNLFDAENNDFGSWFYDEMDPKTLSGNTIYSITERDGDIYLGTNKGYSVFNLKNSVFTRKNSAGENSVQTSLTTCLLADYKENIWIGNGSNGYSLDYLNTKTNKIKHYHDVPYDSTSYSGKDANFIFEDSDRNIWIGTDKGLNKFDPKTETFKLISEKEGLPTKNIVGMLEDDHGVYWLSSNRGLIQYNEDKGDVKCFTTKDGISSNTFSPNAFTKLYSGELVFGSDKGLTVFHPDSIYPNPILPNVALTRMLIYDSLAYDDLSEAQEVKLDFSQNNFTIEFSVLDYINPEKNEYSFRMKGYDKDWISAPYSNRKAKYTNLPYGDYTFQLLASNHDGLWMEEAKELKISISPPWYKSIAAYIFYGFGFVILSFLYGNFRIRRIKQKNQELEESVRLRTEEIKAKTEEMSAQIISELLKESKLDIAKERMSGQEEERKRISRELHDGIGGHLTGIKLFLENMLEESEDEGIQLLLTDIDRLYNEVRNLSHDLLPPEFEETSVKEVLKVYIEQYMLRGHMEINLSFHPKGKWDLVDQMVQIDIYRIVQELLQNAIKHASASEIDLEVVRHDNYIAIMVEDDGKGMSSKDERNGTGLKSLRNRLELINGKIFIDSQFGRGTIVNIEMPIVSREDELEEVNPLNIRS